MTLVSKLLGPHKQSKDTQRVRFTLESQDGIQEAPSTRPAEFIADQDGRHQCDVLKNTAGETWAAPRAPFRHPGDCSNDSTESRRPAVESMMNHVKSVREALPTLQPGMVVTKKSAQVNLLVVRNPKLWLQGDLDGGAGKPGMISAIDLSTDTCTVYWYASGQVHDCSIVRKCWICRPRGTVPGSLVGDDGLASVGMAQAAMEAMRTLFGGRGERGHRATTPVEPFARQMSPSAWQTSPFARQVSCAKYAEKSETAIILDWDDTLFPTTYVKHDLGLSIKQRLKDQRLKPQMMSRVRTALAKAAGAADQLLRLADERGKVVIVTLAKSPWVTHSCRCFYPGIGELIKKLNVQIVYAQEGEQMEYNKVSMMSTEQRVTFWAEVKGKAISKALKGFYSQYEGQSWKNILSMGDSHFERYGTMAATMQYAAAQGLVEKTTSPSSPWPLSSCSIPSTGSTLPVSDVMRHESEGRRMSWEGIVDGQEVKVRTKTVKMLDEPTAEEFIVELRLLHRWLPLMAELDGGFDVDLNSLDSQAEIRKVESALGVRALDRVESPLGALEC